MGSQQSRTISHEKASSDEYEDKFAKHIMYDDLTNPKSTSNPIRWVNIRIRSVEKENHFINNYIKSLEDEFQAYVLKMEKKVGSVKSAKLLGYDVWNYSVLEVENEQGVEKWKTQMIINISKLGKLFNQFPTRKMKK